MRAAPSKRLGARRRGPSAMTDGRTRCSSRRTQSSARRSPSPNRDMRVVVSGLRQDFRRPPFGVMPDLLAHAEFVARFRPVHAVVERRRDAAVCGTAARRRTRARRSSRCDRTPTRTLRDARGGGGRDHDVA